MSLHRLARLLKAAAPSADPASDADLLDRFARGRDGAAFELVVGRHADLVWRTCRRLCRHPADAEDAFQATFLALARRAGAVGRRGAVGGWLHRVAVNAAVKARARSARQPTADADAVAAARAPVTAGVDPDVAEAVRDELARLPDAERLPVVLCDLEGLTHAAAAERLGWPVGTVSGRLFRARAKLRRRLEQRGIVPAVGLAGVLGAAAAGGPPPGLVTTAAAVGLGIAPPGPAVASLTAGVLAMTRGVSWIWVTAGVVAAGAAGGVGFVAGQEKGTPAPVASPLPVGGPPPAARAEAEGPAASGHPPEGKSGLYDNGRVVPAIHPADDAVTKLRKQRLGVAVNILAIREALVQAGMEPRCPQDETEFDRWAADLREVVVAANAVFSEQPARVAWHVWRVDQLRAYPRSFTLRSEGAARGIHWPHM